MKNISYTILKTVFILFLFVNIKGMAQVGVGTLTPDTSAMLDVSSSTKGLLAPRMTTIEKNAIASPANGLLVYDTDLAKFEYFNGTVWTTLQSSNGNTRSNYVLVQSAADFPAPSGGVITLDTNTYYEVNGTIVLGNSIDVNGAYIVGLDANEDILVRGGGTLFSGSKGGTIKTLTLAAPSGTIFNINDTVGDQNLIIQSCIMANSGSVGTLKGFNLVFQNIIQYSGNTTGITYENINDLLMSNLGWFINNSGTYETYVGTFNSIEKVSGFSAVTAGNYAIDVSSNPTVGQGVILGTVFSGSAVPYINKYTSVTNPIFNFDNNWYIDCPGIAVESDAAANGYYYMVGNATQTVFPGADIPTKILGTTTSDNLFRTTDNGGTNNRLVYSGLQTRNFEVLCTGTVDHVINQARQFVFYLYKNGVKVDAISAERRFTNNDVGNFTLIGSLSLDPGDYIEIWIENKGNGTATEVERLSVILR